MFCCSDFKPTVSGIPPGTPKKKNQTALIVGIAVPVAVVALILIFAIIYVKRRKEDDDEEGKSISVSLNIYIAIVVILCQKKDASHWISWFRTLNHLIQDFEGISEGVTFHLSARREVVDAMCIVKPLHSLDSNGEWLVYCK